LVRQAKVKLPVNGVFAGELDTGAVSILNDAIAGLEVHHLEETTINVRRIPLRKLVKTEMLVKLKHGIQRLVTGLLGEGWTVIFDGAYGAHLLEAMVKRQLVHMDAVSWFLSGTF
jgi:hypothetical protein